VSGTLMARFNVEGSVAMPALCRRLDVPYKRCGALVLCFAEEDRPRLEELLERGKKNGVAGLRIVEAGELRELEPNVSPEAVAALYAPTSAIVCPFELTAAMAENAVRNGAEFFFDSPVTDLIREDGLWRVVTAKGDFLTRQVVNAAGVYGAELHNLVSDNKLTIMPRRGEYVLLDQRAGYVVNRTVFQLPGKLGKGVLVTPTVYGNILIGPTADDVPDPEATETTAEGQARILDTAQLSVNDLPRSQTITSFSGLRAHLDRAEHDFYIKPEAPGFYDVIGIESPGLTAAPAIGEYVAGEIAGLLNAAPNADYRPGRDRVIRIKELSFDERAALVAAEPAYGQIICRCEGVTEGEILDAIRRKPGARSLDGVKRRVRAGMGRCQSGFCTPRVLELLSRELGVPMTELTKNGGAPLLVRPLREEA
jgi:glycerol-3-phosphate dehydrogenase